VLLGVLKALKIDMKSRYVLIELYFKFDEQTALKTSIHTNLSEICL